MPDQAPSEYGRWSAGDGLPAIEYSCALLGDIRVLVVDGLHRLSRGGIEVGGILYGTRSGGELRIEAQRPLECEHARGPSFTLSEKDVADLERMLAAPAGTPGLEPVGWYHSHTRADISLSEEDLKIHDHFFPHPWQVALVLRPEKFGPVTAGFFVREADGSIRTDKSYQEFEVLPVKARAAAEPTARRAAPPSPIAPEAVFEPVPARKPPAVMPGKTPGRAPVRDQNQPLRIMAASENRASSDPEKLGAFLRRIEPRRSRKTRWIVGLLLCVAAFFLGMTSRSLWLGRGASPALALHAFDQGGQLRVEWDGATLAVREAKSGLLEINDGGEKVSIPLDREHLLSGGIGYARRTADVDVRLKVTGSGGTAQEVTRFVGPPPSVPSGGAR